MSGVTMLCYQFAGGSALLAVIAWKCRMRVWVAVHLVMAAGCAAFAALM